MRWSELTLKVPPIGGWIPPGREGGGGVKEPKAFQKGFRKGAESVPKEFLKGSQTMILYQIQGRNTKGMPSNNKSNLKISRICHIFV